MTAGRPLKYKTPEEMQAKIDDYFENPPRKKPVFSKDGICIELPVFTITGLALHLGFVDRQSMYDYENRPLFSGTIKRARTFIEREYEEQIQSGNCAGAIFALKNFGWRDKQEIEHSGDNFKITVVAEDERDKNSSDD